MRELVRRVLESAGYEVLAAGLPSEAERLLAEAEHVDLLLTRRRDAGDERLRPRRARARARIPRSALMFMSGYAHTVPGAEQGAGRLLKKPFAPEQLARAVRSRSTTTAPGDRVIPERVLCVDDDAAGAQAPRSPRRRRRPRVRRSEHRRRGAAAARGAVVLGRALRHRPSRPVGPRAARRARADAAGRRDGDGHRRARSERRRTPRFSSAHTATSRSRSARTSC